MYLCLSLFFKILAPPPLFRHAIQSHIYLSRDGHERLSLPFLFTVQLLVVSRFNAGEKNKSCVCVAGSLAFLFVVYIYGTGESKSSSHSLPSSSSAIELISLLCEFRRLKMAHSSYSTHRGEGLKLGASTNRSTPTSQLLLSSSELTSFLGGFYCCCSFSPPFFLSSWWFFPLHRILARIYNYKHTHKHDERQRSKAPPPPLYRTLPFLEKKKETGMARA